MKAQENYKKYFLINLPLSFYFTLFYFNKTVENCVYLKKKIDFFFKFQQFKNSSIKSEANKKKSGPKNKLQNLKLSLV